MRKQVAMESYDVAHGICDHEDDMRPLSLVAFHPDENTAAVSPTRSMIRKYHMLGVNKEFGLSLIEFLGLPRETVHYIMELCAEAATTKATKLNDIEDSLGGS